jgi:hypothetical protein
VADVLVDVQVLLAGPGEGVERGRLWGPGRGQGDHTLTVASTASRRTGRTVAHEGEAGIGEPGCLAG